MKPGDTICFKKHNKQWTRQVYRIGDGYVTVLVGGNEMKVPNHLIDTVQGRLV